MRTLFTNSFNISQNFLTEKLPVLMQLPRTLDLGWTISSKIHSPFCPFDPNTLKLNSSHLKTSFPCALKAFLRSLLDQNLLPSGPMTTTLHLLSELFTSCLCQPSGRVGSECWSGLPLIVLTDLGLGFTLEIKVKIRFSRNLNVTSTCFRSKVRLG